MIKKILAIIIYCILFPVLLFIISPIFIPKWTMGWDNHIGNSFRGFYAEKDNSIEVLFMGNSDIYRGIIPIELYSNYGISSYVYAAPGQRPWTGYYLLLDALRTQKPKIIFYGVDDIIDEDSSEENYRKVFDNMQFSSVKLKAIFSNESYGFSLTEKISYLFPIFRYHDRVSELTKEDFTLAYNKYISIYKGYDLEVLSDAYTGDKQYMNNNIEEYTIPEKSLKYLDLIVEKCKEEKIELIFIEIPTMNPPESWDLAKSKAMSKYAKERDIKFIDLNLLNDEINIDWSYDTPDKGDHLNYYGAKKVTNYIGKYLKDNYVLKDIRDDKDYISWKEHSRLFYEDIIFHEQHKSEYEKYRMEHELDA